MSRQLYLTALIPDPGPRDIVITVYPFSRRARHYDANNAPDTRPLSRISPNAQARSRSMYIILPRTHPARASWCARVCFYVPQVLRGQHGLAAARGGANLGLRRSSQRSLCAASLLHCDEAKSRVLQVHAAL